MPRLLAALLCATPYLTTIRNTVFKLVTGFTLRLAD